MNFIKFHFLKFQKQYILLIGTIFLFIRVIPFANINILLDDSFISFRYAKNLSEGLGLVFNAGEYVEGYTNFLWTILLSFCISLGISAAKSSIFLSFLSTVGILYIMILTIYKVPNFKKEKLLAALFAISIFSLMGSQARFIMSGMETLLFVFLLNLSIYLYFFESKDFLTGFIFGLTTLCRPEGIIYFGIIFLFLFFSKKIQYRRLYKMFFGFSLLFVPHLIWRVSYYGYIFPNTYYAKASGFSIQRIIRGINELKWVLNSWFYWPILFLLIATFFISKKNNMLWKFYVLVLVNFLYFIYVGGDFVIWFGPRFLMPLLPISIVVILIGLWDITYLIKLPINYYVYFRILIFGILIFLVLNYSWPRANDKLEYFSHQMQSWRELGNWMKSNLPENTTLAVDAAGIIPFYTNFYTVDMYGLTNEYIAHLPIQTGIGTIAHEKFDADYILLQNTDCIFSSWINEEGDPLSAGLGNVKEELRKNYSLIVISQTRYKPGTDIPLLLAYPDYSKGHFDNGYVSGLYCKKSFIDNLAN